MDGFIIAMSVVIAFAAVFTINVWMYRTIMRTGRDV